MRSYVDLGLDAILPHAPPSVGAQQRFVAPQQQQQRVNRGVMARRAPTMDSRPVSEERRSSRPGSNSQQQAQAPQEEPGGGGLWDRVTAPLSSYAPRAPSRVFQMVAAPIEARTGNLAYFVWRNRGEPVELQFVQGEGVRITHVELNGRVIYDGETPRVGFDRMPVVPSQGHVTIRATVQPWQGPGVQLGILRSSSDTTGGVMNHDMSNYVDMGLDAVSGFEVQAKAHMDTMDWTSKTFDITADVPWRSVFVVSGVVSSVVAAVMIVGQVVLRSVSKNL